MRDHGRIGALVIGGDHPGLGVARSLGPRGIPVYILDDLPSVSLFSRYVTRVIRTKDLRGERASIDAVIEACVRFGLQGWVLFPTRDEHVAAFARNREELSKYLRVTTPAWETVEWAWDKKKTYEISIKLGIPVPRTWSVARVEDLPLLCQHLPLAIKPAIKERFFYATKRKAWRADSPMQLHRAFTRAAAIIKKEEILLQEIIPGGGGEQFSFCGFCRNGRVHSSLVACRRRQHPREFGRAATYVESADVPVIEELAGRFVEAIDYYGPVEIEFKRDPRDGRYKLLDVNARTWGFHSLGLVAGVDFPYLLYADQVGLPITPCRGETRVGWMRMLTDLPTAIGDICAGHLELLGYIKSIKNTRIEAVFAREDPLPAIAEFLLLPYLVIKKYL